MTTRLPIYDGIDGLRSSEPIGAVLSIGTRKGNSQPTDRDRFYWKLPKVDGTGARPDHPSFSAYNAAPPERRKVVQAVVVHARREQWATWSLMAYAKRGEQTPNRQPWCTGDGVRATRWNHKAGEFVEIRCPHDRCEYRLDTPTTCKPLVRVLFQPVWPAGADGRSLPSPLSELDSHSWHSAGNLRGMVEHVEEQARLLGVPDGAWSWYGFGFTIQLTEQTSPARKSRFPVLRFSPACNVQAWLIDQAQRRDALASAYRRDQPALDEPSSVIDVGDIAAALSGPKETT